LHSYTEVCLFVSQQQITQLFVTQHITFCFQ